MPPGMPMMPPGMPGMPGMPPGMPMMPPGMQMQMPPGQPGQQVVYVDVLIPLQYEQNYPFTENLYKIIRHLQFFQMIVWNRMFLFFQEQGQPVQGQGPPLPI